MKTIGLLGGMSWESTQSYYRSINLGVKAALGGLHSAKLVLKSVDFAEIERLQHSGDWDALAQMLSDEAQAVQAAGADCLLICTNTMHKVAPSVEDALAIPLLHIADATAEALVRDGVAKVGLLGTAFTMEEDFYKGRLERKFALEVLVPEPSDRKRVHEVIYKELCQGVVKAESRAYYLSVIEDLAQQGCEAIIMGCTEIALLIGDAKCSIKLYDTTALHAQKAVDFALA